MNKFYAGIGSRLTPPNILKTMKELAGAYALNGWVLRSGGATGADTAFEQGCKEHNGKCEIYLPWPGYNDNLSEYANPPVEAFYAALDFHPNSSAIMKNDAVWKLMARNVQQILGEDLQQPLSRFVLCWTPDGAERGEDTTVKTGGTGHAIRIATVFNIPVFNLKNNDALYRLVVAFERLKSNEIIGD